MADSEGLPQIWDKVVRYLAEASDDPSSTFPALSALQKAWLPQVKPMGFTAGFALLAAPNRFAKEAIEQSLRDPISQALSHYLGQPVNLAVVIPDSTDIEEPSQPTPKAEPSEPHQLPALSVPPNPADPSPWPRPPMLDVDATLAEELPPAPPVPFITEERETEQPPRDWAIREPVRAPVVQSPAVQKTAATLNKRYTFDTYVVGTSNRFASAAAWAVAEEPAKAYNPLFLWGGSGLGKTHLLHAIGNYALSLYPELRVRYISTEEFTNDFINSLRDDRKSAFKKRYRDVDILLVDDIQFLESKEGTQEEFFYTFESLHNANKQIVISSDRPPKQLATLEDRLRTRFEGGLITDIQPPDVETRIAILKLKAEMDNVDVPQDVLELIATTVERNIRELEGALIRVTAFASLDKQPLTPDLASLVLRDLIHDGASSLITAPVIMAVTAEYYQTTVEELCGPGRNRSIARARQVAMYLSRELTDLSLPKIGATFGGRDHSTVLHAQRKISNSLTEDRKLFKEVQDITSRVKTVANK